MLAFFSVVVMLAVGYAYLVEGLFTALTMFVNVVLAGIIAMNFFEPAAVAVDQLVQGTFLSGYEDAVCMVVVFCVALAALRYATNRLARVQVDFPQIAQQGGGAVVGLATGYLVSGFLTCALQTIPFHNHFMGFDPTYEQEQFMRRILPPDRVWLALMHRAGDKAFSNGTETFDEQGSFELRYARYRRYDDSRGPMPYYGEFDHEGGQQQGAGPPPPPPPAPGSATPAPGPAGTAAPPAAEKDKQK